MVDTKYFDIFYKNHNDDENLLNGMLVDLRFKVKDAQEDLNYFISLVKKK